ncbi:Alpha/Beta hydrolase fold [Elaphomyces granulatus]
MLASKILKSLPSSSRRFFSTSKSFPIELSYELIDGSIKSGRHRYPILFLHGFFGSKQNNRTISKILARDLNRRVFVLDLRNHGNTEHVPEHNYISMTGDVENFIDQHQLRKAVLIGHSMGAKTAMTVALQSPGLVSALIPVDNAPVRSPLRSDVDKYVRGMQEIESAKVTKSSDADKILQKYEKSLPIRQFLLTNLTRSVNSPTLKFRIPLGILANSLDDMSGFPFEEPSADAKDGSIIKYDGPTLVVRGTKSRYVGDETIPTIKRFFPKSSIADIEAGHWVISEKPEAFRKGMYYLPSLLGSFFMVSCVS